MFDHTRAPDGTLVTSVKLLNVSKDHMVHSQPLYETFSLQGMGPKSVKGESPGSRCVAVKLHPCYVYGHRGMSVYYLRPEACLLDMTGFDDPHVKCIFSFLGITRLDQIPLNEVMSTLEQLLGNFASGVIIGAPYFCIVVFDPSTTTRRVEGEIATHLRCGRVNEAEKLLRFSPEHYTWLIE